jgi:hypothetical protein
MNAKTNVKNTRNDSITETLLKLYERFAPEEVKNSKLETLALWRYHISNPDNDSIVWRLRLCFIGTTLLKLFARLHKILLHVFWGISRNSISCLLFSSKHQKSRLT